MAATSIHPDRATTPDERAGERHSGRHSGRQGDRHSEKGVALVELALVASLLVTLALGIFEIGSAWSDHQSLTQASRAGARVGSQLGTNAATDNEALRSVQASLGGVKGTITKVVIYEADANGDMPAACETASAGYSGGANCNVYDEASLALLNVPGQWGSGTSCGAADGNWCSVSERDDVQGTATFVGVYVEFEREYLTGMFGGGSHTISETTVMRIEPQD